MPTSVYLAYEWDEEPPPSIVRAAQRVAQRIRRGPRPEQIVAGSTVEVSPAPRIAPAAATAALDRTPASAARARRTGQPRLRGQHQGRHPLDRQHRDEAGQRRTRAAGAQLSAGRSASSGPAPVRAVGRARAPGSRIGARSRAGRHASWSLGADPGRASGRAPRGSTYCSCANEAAPQTYRAVAGRCLDRSPATALVPGQWRFESRRNESADRVVEAERPRRTLWKRAHIAEWGISCRPGALRSSQRVQRCFRRRLYR
jgi:hypothetical protein